MFFLGGKKRDFVGLLASGILYHFLVGFTILFIGLFSKRWCELLRFFAISAFPDQKDKKAEFSAFSFLVMVVILDFFRNDKRIRTSLSFSRRGLGLILLFLFVRSYYTLRKQKLKSHHYLFFSFSFSPLIFSSSLLRRL